MSQQLDQVLSARIPKELLEYLQEIAKERQRKTVDIVREALEMYISNWAEYKIAIDRLKNPSDPMLSEEEFLEELGWDI